MTLKKMIVVSCFILQIFSKANGMEKRVKHQIDQKPITQRMSGQKKWYDNPERFNPEGWSPLKSAVCCLGCTAFIVSYAKDTGLLDNFFEFLNEKES